MISVKLCYCTYEAKMSLGAMKRFKELSGCDLWSTLCEFLTEFNKCRTEEVAILEMMHRLYKVCDFEKASFLFFSMIKETNSALDLDQIQDGMFRVGWRPSELDEEGQCWPIVMVKLATDVDEYFKELVSEEKKTRTNSGQ